MADDDLRRDYQEHGFAGRLGFGRHPALLLVDFVKAYTTPSSPLFAAPGVPDAVAATVPVLSAARKAGLPVIYTKVRYAPGGVDGGLFVKKIPALLELAGDSPLAEIVDQLAPQPGEIVIDKRYASAFFGTHLASTLTALGVDTLVLVGCSTSGCIRATAVDGLQHGFRVMIPRECVGDRSAEVHQANLFDLDGKYADLLSTEQVLEQISKHQNPSP